MTPAQQLKSFLDRYDAGVAKDARAAIARMKELTRGSHQMVYDNYNALVVGFSPTLRPSEALFSIAVMPTHATLCFLQGAHLPDPHKLLRGSGSQVRHIRLEAAVGGPKFLDDPRVLRLIREAIRSAVVTVDPRQKGTLIIRSISAKQRPRKPSPFALAGGARTAKKSVRKAPGATVKRAAKQSRPGRGSGRS